jgi:hypothetical protein
MGLFPGLLIIIIVLVIISIIIIVAVVLHNGTKNTPTNNTCSNQSECHLGFVCVEAQDESTNICKAGLGTACDTDSDCALNLSCSSNDKICVSTTTADQVRVHYELPIKQTFSENIIKISDLTSHNQPKDSLIIPETASVITEIIPPSLVSVLVEENKQTVPAESQEPIISDQNQIIMSDPIISEMINSDQMHTPISGTPDIIRDKSQNPATVKSAGSLRIPTRRMIMREDRSVTPLTGTGELNPHIVRQESNNINIIPRMSRHHELYFDETSLDDEINSGGDYIDAPFDVRSAETPRDMMSSFRQEDFSTAAVSSPYEDKNGIYYCRNQKKETISNDNSHSPVIDVCSYSNAVLFLLEEGNIMCEIKSSDTKHRYKTSNNIRLTRITSFSGYLHGVGVDNLLYTLPNDLFSTTNWIWVLTEWAPKEIEHISSTYDSKHIWIQTSGIGYLYNSPGVVVVKAQCSGIKRVYGRDIDHYIDINPVKHTATIYPGETFVPDVYDGALSYYDELVAIRPSESSDYKSISIVNWRPYYIRA